MKVTTILNIQQCTHCKKAEEFLTNHSGHLCPYPPFSRPLERPPPPPSLPPSAPLWKSRGWQRQQGAAEGQGLLGNRYSSGARRCYLAGRCSQRCFLMGLHYVGCPGPLAGHSFSPQEWGHSLGWRHVRYSSPPSCSPPRVHRHSGYLALTFAGAAHQESGLWQS